MTSLRLYDLYLFGIITYQMTNANLRLLGNPTPQTKSLLYTIFTKPCLYNLQNNSILSLYPRKRRKKENEEIYRNLINNGNGIEHGSVRYS